MKFIRTSIKDVIICEPQVFGDHRGYFFESFRADSLENFLGFKVDFCQDNESKSKYGVLRGLHFQKEPHIQSKLVRVMEGKVLDMAVDLRKGSPTFGQHVAVELSSENRKQMFIPRGFAHGFAVLSETAILAYKCDNYYTPKLERGLLFNDSSLGIDWKLPEKDLILSDKDKNQPSLAKADVFNYSDEFYSHV